jgi:hypothetical protein
LPEKLSFFFHSINYDMAFLIIIGLFERVI